MVICNVAKILELVVPLMDHPSETFLTTIEEDLMKLIIKYGMTVSKEAGFTCTREISQAVIFIYLFNSFALSFLLVFSIKANIEVRLIFRIKLGKEKFFL